MTDDRSLERAARSFIEVGPTRAPDHAVNAALLRIQTTTQERDWLPWRFPRMTTTTRIAALVAIAALILGSIAVIGGIGGISPPAPPVPSLQPSQAVPSLGALGTRFTSPRNGFQVWVPADWSSIPATKPWVFGARPMWGDDTLDELQGDDVRFSVAAQRIPDDVTPDEWLRSYCMSDGSTAETCADVGERWPRIRVGGTDGFLTLDGVPALEGAIVGDATIFDAVVVGTRHAYAFTLDGHVDRSMFDALLETVVLDPVDAVDLPPLTETFTSDRYGYAIDIGPDWETAAGTDDGGARPGPDQFAFTGTDTAAEIGSDPLTGGQTFEDYLVARHDEALADLSIPSGCDGGDPTSWPAIQMGSASGRLQQLCNAALAFAEVGGRVYRATWGNSTFTTDDHLSEASWKAWLAGLQFDPASAQD